MTDQINYTGKTNWILKENVGPDPFNRVEGGVISAINAINSVITELGGLANLNTQIKTSYTGAINELVASIANVINTINFNTPGCINSGAVAGGEANVLSYSGQNISLATGTILTLMDRTKVTLANAVTLANSITVAGTYFLFYFAGGLLPVANWYVQRTQPSPTGTAIWYDTSVEPVKAKYFDGASWIGSAYNCAYSGAYTVANSAVASVIQPTFNKNFYDFKEQPFFDYGVVATGSIGVKLDRLTKVTPGADLTINLPTNVPKGVEVQCEVELTNGTTVYTIYQPAVTWDWGSSPMLTTASKKYKIFYTTTDGGATWTGSWKQCGV